MRHVASYLLSKDHVENPFALTKQDLKNLASNQPVEEEIEKEGYKAINTCTKSEKKGNHSDFNSSKNFFIHNEYWESLRGIAIHKPPPNATWI